MHDLTARKRALRAETRQRRRARGEQLTVAAGEGILEQARLVIEERSASSIACYLSAPLEPNTRPLLNWAVDAGIRVLLPVTREDGLLDWVVADGTSERTHELGFPEATGERLDPMAVDDVDVFFLPASSVDRSGLRLGWGRGYYDRTLGSMTRTPPTFAIVHDDELVDAVPHEPHDMPVSGVVTPTRVVVF